MKYVQSGIAAVGAELHLHLQVILRDGVAAHRADHTNSRPAPGPVGSLGRHLSCAYRFSGFRAQNSLIGHGSSPGPGGCVMPDARRPGRLFASPAEPDGRRSLGYTFEPRQVRVLLVLSSGRAGSAAHASREATRSPGRARSGDRAACGILRPGRGAPHSHVSTPRPGRPLDHPGGGTLLHGRARSRGALPDLPETGCARAHLDE